MAAETKAANPEHYGDVMTISRNGYSSPSTASATRSASAGPRFTNLSTSTSSSRYPSVGDPSSPRKALRHTWIGSARQPQHPPTIRVQLPRHPRRRRRSTRRCGR